MDLFLQTGLAYHGKAADTWALGITLYYLVLGHYPFLGDTLQETYDKVLADSIFINHLLCIFFFFLIKLHQ